MSKLNETKTSHPRVLDTATCSASLISLDDVLICSIDEWRHGDPSYFDCHVQSITKKGVNVYYLSGYRSRNDFVPWKDIVAKVDKSKPWVSLDNVPFSGNFHVFL